MNGNGGDDDNEDDDDDDDDDDDGDLPKIKEVASCTSFYNKPKSHI